MTGKEETGQSREDNGIPPRFFVVHSRRKEDAKHPSERYCKVNSTENSRTADRTSMQPVFQSAIDKDMGCIECLETRDTPERNSSSRIGFSRARPRHTYNISFFSHQQKKHVTATTG